MSGHKQPAVVKQTREVASTVYLAAEALLSAIDNLLHWVVSQESRFNTVGDPHQQEANKLPIWRRKYVAVKHQTGHGLAVFLLLIPCLSYSTQWQSYAKAQTDVIQGMAHALCSTTPTLTSQLTQIQGAERAPHTDSHFSQAWVCVDLKPEGVHCRAVRPSYNLQTSFDKVVTCLVRLFLLLWRRHPETDFMIMLQPKSKDNTFTRVRCHLLHVYISWC